MAKKLCSWHVLCTLSVLTATVFFIACGDGEVVEVGMGEIGREINAAQTNLTDTERLQEILKKPSSSSVEKSSSSESEGKESSSSGGNPNGGSSSGTASSSSSPSSSSTEPSSSSESLFELKCTIVTTTMRTNTLIPKSDRPKVECKRISNGNVTTLDSDNDVSWFYSTSAPLSWYAVEAGTYTNSIKIEVDGDCKGIKGVTCSGTLTVTGATPSSSSRAASSSSVASTTSSSSRASSSSSSVASSSSRASSSSASGNTTGPCTQNNKALYCKWGNDCHAIDSQHSTIDGANGCSAGNCTCPALIKNCSDYGYLYDSSSCSGTDLNGKNPSTVTILGCCKWDSTNNNCWTLKSDASNTDCPNLLNKGNACASTNGACP